MNQMIIISRILVALLVLFSFPAMALKDDFKQQIFIDADNAVIEEGKSVYTGNVIVNQGGMQMRSARLEVYLVDRRPEKVVATGNPVFMKQIVETDKLERHGKSSIAEYYINKSLIVMKGNASVWLEENNGNGFGKKGDQMNSEQITYDYKAEIVKAGKKGQAGEKNRVHTVLNPMFDR
ncbi:MAG: lipopolysaccharide transport periplasmic protein LptA [Gammaproteobacteria bacterium]|nr:lipopolysaccharide transport periplasmic protein LptA [Gammaproteobacteria bacterium]